MLCEKQKHIFEGILIQTLKKKVLVWAVLKVNAASIGPVSPSQSSFKL